MVDAIEFLKVIFAGVEKVVDIFTIVQVAKGVAVIEPDGIKGLGCFSIFAYFSAVNIDN